MSAIPKDISALLGNTDETDIKQKIVEELLINTKNLDTKTELSKPIQWSCMSMIEDVLKTKSMPYSSSLLRKFTQKSFTYLISKDRKGRNEYVEALKSFSSIAQPNPKINSNLMS